MTIYRSVGGVNRTVKAQYRSVGGVNRTIKEQYRGHGGVNKKVFSNWSWNGELYSSGNEYATITGGWNGYVGEYTCACTKYGSTLFVLPGEPAGRGGFSTGYKINVTYYSKLKAIISGTGRIVFGLNSTNNTGGVAGCDTANYLLEPSSYNYTTVEINISNITGSYYAIFMCYNSMTTGMSGNLHGMWLE